MGIYAGAGGGEEGRRRRRRRRWDFHLKSNNSSIRCGELEKCYEIGQILVLGALKETTKVHKASEDIFATFGFEKHSIWA